LRKAGSQAVAICIKQCTCYREIHNANAMTDPSCLQIHDQGAGGNCNVVKEIIYPLGAEIDIRAIKLGDETMSVLEIWGAEYQENDCILIRPEDRDFLQAVCDRERCYMQVRSNTSAQRYGTFPGTCAAAFQAHRRLRGPTTPIVFVSRG
jgi:phosphoribosylformylglycinamidine (FGAM) synthase-like enzyme